MGDDKTAQHLEIDATLRDGFEVHAAALERGMDITLLPRQVLMVGFGNPVIGDASFVHGVPQSSTVAGVTYAQDKRVRRSLLSRHGFTVPPGATFSIGRSAASAIDFAQRIGFPVVVKPTMGDNTIGVLPGIEGVQGMEEAIEYLHTPLEERNDFTRASYAMTELREPGVHNGKLAAPPSYRFLVESEVSGHYVRLLIVGGTVVNAMYCPEGPWKTNPQHVQDVTDQIHKDVADYAIEASKVIPGLPLVALDMVVPDLRRPGPRNRMFIVEFSERPWLDLQWRYDEGLARKLAAEILRFELRGKPSGTPLDRVSAAARIDGAVAPELLSEALSRKAGELGLEASVEVTDPALGHITGNIAGAPRLIAGLMEAVLDEGVEGHRAMLIELRDIAA